MRWVGGGGYGGGYRGRSNAGCCWFRHALRTKKGPYQVQRRIGIGGLRERGEGRGPGARAVSAVLRRAVGVRGGAAPARPPLPPAAALVRQCCCSPPRHPASDTSTFVRSRSSLCFAQQLHHHRRTSRYIHYRNHAALRHHRHRVPSLSSQKSSLTPGAANSAEFAPAHGALRAPPVAG